MNRNAPTTACARRLRILSLDISLPLGGHSFAWFVFGFFSFALPSGVWAQSSESDRCVVFFRSELFARAAACFEKINTQLKHSAHAKSKVIRLLRGRMLQHAVRALEASAQKEPQTDVAAYTRTLAVKLLQEYLDERLFSGERHKKDTLLAIFRLKQQIGLAPLTIVSGDAKARIVLTGYHAHFEAIGNFSESVRPGSYRLKVFYPGRRLPVSQDFVVPPHQNKLLTLSPPPLPIAKPRLRLIARTSDRSLPALPPPPRRPHILPWILISIGAAMAVTGGLFLILAKSADDEKYTIYQRIRSSASTAQSEHTDQILSLHQQATLFFPIGWIVLGSGVASAVLGSVLFAIPPSASPQPPREAHP